MARKEERIEASIDYQMSTNPMALGGAAFEDMIRKMNVNHSFVAGAEWADKTMIDKACEWLESVNLDYYQIREGVFSRELVIDFRKAME